ncbi:antibiotic biosynthesis monooxygenase family protein [Pontibacter ruber]|uniref:Antibiotic biosynthesis monooxygenase family protein n=1 Tax=Pontibacter ruber TaxID=1343895 RepID=A0ABW5CYF2_9BACT|nr:antibiotic biosynthesis monooxygenase [Pontibacter ruber]
MFIALSVFEIANDMAKEVKEAFIARPHQVDTAIGFLGMKVFSPQENVNEFWVMTSWTDEDSYKVWYKDHMKEAHQGIPKGLKLVPGSLKVRFFDQVSQ